MQSLTAVTNAVRIRTDSSFIDGDLTIPQDSVALVIFAHGSGSSRFSSRNRFVAETLQRGGCATLLVDLLTPHEEAVDLKTREYRFEIDRLAYRVIARNGYAAE